MILLISLWMACSGGGQQIDDKESDPVTEPDTGPVACDDDDACEYLEICGEEGFCEPGDRNNALAEAEELLFNQPASGVIQSEGDVDFFRFETLEDGQWVLIQTVRDTEAEVQLDTVVRLYRANGQEYAWADNYDQYRVSTADSSLVAWLPDAGEWFVSVEDVSSYFEFDDLRGSEDFTYDLTVEEFTAVMEEGDEPMLVELESGTRLSRRGFLIEEPGDVDEITLVAPYDDRQIQVSGGRGLLGTDLTLSVTFERDGQLVSLQPDLNELTYGMVLRAQSGDYTVKLTDRDGEGSTEHWFVVVFRTYEEDDAQSFWGEARYTLEEEPNDDPLTAAEVDMDRDTTSGGNDYEAAFVEGTIDVAGDVDAYRVPITSGNFLTARCYADRVGSTADLVFEVRDLDGTVLETVDRYEDWAAPQLYNYEIGDREAVVVTVHDVGDTAGAAAFYRCQFFDTDFEVIE